MRPGAPRFPRRAKKAGGDAEARAPQDMAVAAPPAGAAIHGTTSYAKLMQNPEVEKKVASVAGNYNGLLNELRKAGAKGVVVTVNGHITWADVFASTDLLEKYWQKLIRSYAAESLTNARPSGQADQKAAQAFVDQLGGPVLDSEAKPQIRHRRRLQSLYAGFSVAHGRVHGPCGEDVIHRNHAAWRLSHGKDAAVTAVRVGAAHNFGHGPPSLSWIWRAPLHHCRPSPARSIAWPARLACR